MAGKGSLAPFGFRTIASVAPPPFESCQEISSISNFETFQANRLKLRFKDKDGKNKLTHTLNGSSLALPRVLAGILENYQTPEGIKIPDVLIPYCGFDFIKE